MKFTMLAVAAMLPATAVLGDTLNIQTTGLGNGREVRVSIGSMSKTVFAGRILANATSGYGSNSIVAFSTDLLQQLPSATGQYQTSPLSHLSGNGGLTNLGFAKMDAIYDIAAAADNRQLVLGHDFAAAFQIALWEIVYDFNPNLPGYGLDTTTGTFRASQVSGAAMSNSIQEKLSFLFASIGIDSGGELQVLGYQSQAFGDLIMIAPLPQGVLLGMMGLAGAGLVVAHRRRTLRGV